MTTVIRNGDVLTTAGLVRGDVLMADEQIVEIVHPGTAAGSAGGSSEEIDATGCLVLPGIVDAHVHFNEPGRTAWEGFATGSRALAAGGGTSFVDMPLNASPPTIDAAAFELKRQAGEASSVLDFALWGGLVPGNSDDLEALTDCGVVGFKAFMIGSGMEDFPGVNARELRRGMSIAARLGLPVAVHAEDAELVEARTRVVRATGRTDASAYLESRPVESELAAIRVALDLAGETRCALHVVHVSCPDGLALIAAAREQGVDVTGEVCPHHLLLTGHDMEIHGALAKCSPPLRDDAQRESLWRKVLAGEVDTVGSDHSPAPPDLKTGDDLFAAWGGIMGCQHGFLLLLDRVLAEAPDRLAEFWGLVSARPADRMGLGDRKGRIAPGADADLVVVRRISPRTITAAELLTRHQTSPYVGREICCRVDRTLVRGRTVLRDTDPAAGLPAGGGRFLKRRT